MKSQDSWIDFYLGHLITFVFLQNIEMIFQILYLTDVKYVVIMLYFPEFTSLLIILVLLLTAFLYIQLLLYHYSINNIIWGLFWSSVLNSQLASHFSVNQNISIFTY